MKKIVVFGGTGTVGNKIVEALKGRAEVISVGSKSGDYQADIKSDKSLHDFFEKVGKVDAVVAASGDVAFAPLNDLNREQWLVGVESKFLGQVNVATVAQKYLNQGGSITLTSGILSEEYILAGVSATAINRAIEGFAQAAAFELKNGLRINVVSPGMLEESKSVYGDFFPGHIAVPGAKVAQGFLKSIFGIESGKIYKVF